MACSLGFYGDEISFRVSFGQSSDSESFLVAHALLSQDGCQRGGFWEVVGHVVFPFDLSRTLLVGGGLLVLCSLPGPPVIKLLMQMVTVVPGQGELLQSACSPLQFYLITFPTGPANLPSAGTAPKVRTNRSTSGSLPGKNLPGILLGRLLILLCCRDWSKRESSHTVKEKC